MHDKHSTECARPADDSASVDIMWWMQIVRLSGHRGRLCCCGRRTEIKPLPSKRAGSELQSSRRLRSKAALCWAGWSTLETGNSQVESYITSGWELTHILCNNLRNIVSRWTAFVAMYEIESLVRVFLLWKRTCWTDFVYSTRVDHGGEKRLRFGQRKCKCWIMLRN